MIHYKNAYILHSLRDVGFFFLDSCGTLLYNNRIMKEEKTVRIDARLTAKEKEILLKLARSKGCEGVTAFLRMLVKAKKVDIRL